MFRNRSSLAPDRTTHMNRHTAAFVQNLHRPSRQAHIDIFVHQRIRNAVEVVVCLDVVINVDLGFSPLGKLIALRGKRL